MMVGGSRFEAPRGSAVHAMEFKPRSDRGAYLLERKISRPWKLAVVVGCDGSHGILSGTRSPTTARENLSEKIIPSGGWEFFAAVAPSTDELVYALSRARVRACIAMRSQTISRLYLQCSPERCDPRAGPDERIWAELQPPVRHGRVVLCRRAQSWKKGHHAQCAARLSSRCVYGKSLPGW